MTPEQIDRTIEFILAHQANHAVRLEKTQDQLQTLAALVQTVSQEMNARDQLLSAKMEKTSEEVQALKDACHDLLDKARRTDVRLNRLENLDR